MGTFLTLVHVGYKISYWNSQVFLKGIMLYAAALENKVVLTDKCYSCISFTG